MIRWLECETALAPRFGSRKCNSWRGVGEGGGHAVIEVFTTGQECDGTENVGDSDAWASRLVCTGCGVVLWVVMPPFIVLQLKGPFITEARHCTVRSFWSGTPRNKDRVSTVPADAPKMLHDGWLKERGQI